MDMTAMGANEWLLVGSALVGPILAVQTQKLVERLREASVRREHVFFALMATRQARVSPDHVRALNSIDLAFYGARVLGHSFRSKASQAVLDAWNTYRAHLGPPAEKRPKNAAEEATWNATGDELFVNLLERLAAANSYAFDREALKTNSYSPEAHSVIENEQHAVRRLAVAVLSGEKSLRMDITKMPSDPDTAVRWKNALDAVASHAKPRDGAGGEVAVAHSAPP